MQRAVPASVTVQIHFVAKGAGEVIFSDGNMNPDGAATVAGFVSRVCDYLAIRCL